jgi:putative DNA methylase
VTLRRRRLPHFDVIGQPQFITFRLHDSLPPNRPFQTANLTSGEAFLAMDRLLDQNHIGPTYLRNPAVAEVVRDSFHRGEELGHYELHAWVIMPNHIHLLLTPQVSLSKLLGSMKSATAKRANGILNRDRIAFWQDESYDHLVRDRDQFRNIQRYIENNPVTAGLVAVPQDYIWSSAAIPK